MASGLPVWPSLSSQSTGLHPLKHRASVGRGAAAAVEEGPPAAVVVEETVLVTVSCSLRGSAVVGCCWGVRKEAPAALSLVPTWCSREGGEVRASQIRHTRSWTPQLRPTRILFTRIWWILPARLDFAYPDPSPPPGSCPPAWM